MFFTILLLVLLTAGVLPKVFITEYGIQMGFPLALALISVSLWDRVRQIQEEHNRLLESQVEERTRDLREALDNVKTLHGLIPICSDCKSVRDDQGYWSQIEGYIRSPSQDFFCNETKKQLK